MRRALIGLSILTAGLALSGAGPAGTAASESAVVIRVTSPNAQPVNFKIGYWSDIQAHSGGVERARTPFGVRVVGSDVRALVVANSPTQDLNVEIQTAPGTAGMPGRGVGTFHGAAILYRSPTQIGVAGF